MRRAAQVTAQGCFSRSCARGRVRRLAAAGLGLYSRTWSPTERLGRPARVSGSAAQFWREWEAGWLGRVGVRVAAIRGTHVLQGCVGRVGEAARTSTGCRTARVSNRWGGSQARTGGEGRREGGRVEHLMERPRGLRPELGDRNKLVLLVRGSSSSSASSSALERSGTSESVSPAPSSRAILPTPGAPRRGGVRERGASAGSPRRRPSGGVPLRRSSGAHPVRAGGPTRDRTGRRAGLTLNFARPSSSEPSTRAEAAPGLHVFAPVGVSAFIWRLFPLGR